MIIYIICFFVNSFTYEIIFFGIIDFAFEKNSDIENNMYIMMCIFSF